MLHNVCDINVWRLLMTKFHIIWVTRKKYLYENRNICQQLFVAFRLEYTCIFLQWTVVLLHQGFTDRRIASRTGRVSRSLPFVTICYSKNICYIFIFQIVKFPNVLKLPKLISFSGLAGRSRTTFAVRWAHSFIWICSKYIIGLGFQVSALHFFFSIHEEKFSIMRYGSPYRKVWKISIVVTKLSLGIQKSVEQTVKTATSLLVTDVGDGVCWRQVWDDGVTRFGDQFEMLRTILSIEKVTNINYDFAAHILELSSFSNHQHNIVNNITVAITDITSEILLR